MANKSGYQIRDQYAHYFLTFQVVDWLDIFTRQRYRDIVINSFRHCQEVKGLNIYGWVIMSNHIHCILSSLNGQLSNTIRDFKKHTSKTIVKSIISDIESRREWLLDRMAINASMHKRNKQYQVWTHDNHPIALEGEMFDQRLDYIHQNPVRAGIVDEAFHYTYSSARDYMNDEKGLLQIDFI